MLEAFGILFTRDIKIYLYPFFKQESQKMIDSTNLEIHPRTKPLYEYLIFNKRVVDLKDYDKNVLGIFSTKVLQMIKSGTEGWEKMVPTYVDILIKKNKLFGYKSASVKEKS